jgi:hypothetical protein
MDGKMGKGKAMMKMMKSKKKDMMKEKMADGKKGMKGRKR